MADNHSLPRIELLGPPGAGKATLLRLLNTAEGNSPVTLALDEKASRDADALILACPADTEPAALPAILEPLAEQLNHLTRLRGQDCEVAALPVFLVLTKCDLLARPDDALGDWLERIEAGKQLAGQSLRSQLANGNGFGTPALHVWATAQKRPTLTGGSPSAAEPFGVLELHQQAAAAASDYQRRAQQQARRLHGLIWLSAGLLLLLALVTVAWGILSPTRRETAVPDAPKAWPQGDYLVEGAELLTSAQKLLRFEDYRPGRPASTDWPRWYREAQILVNDLQEVRGRLEAERIGQALGGDLQAAQEALAVLQQRAALFGLAGELPERPAALHFPAEPIPYQDVRKQAQERLALLAKQYPTFVIEPLSPLVPLGVAAELEGAAQVSYEKLLAPVQVEIRSRVLKLGEGRETPKAWRELADGWLSVQAENELNEWRELAVLLQRLAGRPQPSDPLTQLNGFVRRTTFALPLERIELNLPSTLKARGETLTGLKPADAPLVITLRTEADEVTTLNLLPLGTARTLPGEPDRYLYGVPRQNPLVNGRLQFKPGDEVSARLKISDGKEERWLLSWPLADSRSLVWSFNVLSQAPRIHREHETATGQGTIAFGARLVLSEPLLFELPDLIPK